MRTEIEAPQNGADKKVTSIEPVGAALALSANLTDATSKLKERLILQKNLERERLHNMDVMPSPTLTDIALEDRHSLAMETLR